MEKQFNGHSKKGGVYQIKNLISGKVYVGSAREFKRRASQHQTQLIKQKHRNQYLQNAWNKDRADNFLFEVLEVVEGDRLARTTREQCYINQYLENWEMCYNLLKSCVQTQGPWSKTPEKTRKKQSLARKGKHYSPATEFKPGHIPWTRTNGHREETKAVIGEKSKKTWNKKSHQKKMAKIHSSKEFREFQGNRIKDLWSNPEYKEKRLEYYNSDEFREIAISRAQKNWNNQDFHEKMISIHNSFESKTKKSISHLRNKEAARFLLDKDWLYEQYCVKKLLAPEIARQLNVSKHTIYKWLDNHLLR